MTSLEDVKLKITYEIESEVTLDAGAQAYLLKVLSLAKDAGTDVSKYAAGFMRAARRVSADDTAEQALRILVAEVTVDLMRHLLPRLYPSQESGMKSRFKHVGYSTTPEQLDVGENAVPVVITKQESINV